MKYIKYLLAFIIPVSIFCLCLLINKVAPFGKSLITIYDSRVQYPGFFMALKNFHFYKFNAGFGFNFYGLMAYYLMNPLNLIVKFFDILNYNTFYFILIILRIGLCGLSMQYFLSHEEKHDNLWSIIFSTIYALIGYVSSYYYNVFWIDGIIMLPLILVGINKIVDNKSSLFYIITLAISLIISFYTGYMNCIFSVLYFIYKIVEKGKYKDKKVILNFIISSLIAALVAAFVLVPTFFALMAGKASGFKDDFTKYFAFDNNIKYLFYSLTPGNFHSKLVGNDGFAQNFCTLFVVVFFITSFFNKKIDIKTKSITLIIILFYFLSYSFNLVDYAWQFFQKPIWWQHRYSYTLSLFMIIIAYKQLMNYDGYKASVIKKGIIYGVLASLIIVSGLIFYFNLDTKENFRLFIGGYAILLLIIYLFFFDSQRKIFKFIILTFIFLEVGVNTFICVKQNARHESTSTVSYDLLSKKQIMTGLEEIKKDKSFYRTELVSRYSYNDGLYFDYNGINYFNSVRNQKVINALEDYLPVTVDSHQSITMNQFDPYVISLFNIKYLISDTNIKYLEDIGNKAYQNPYPLSLGFMVNKDVLKVKLTKEQYQDNLTLLYNKMLNQDNKLYLPVENPQISYENVRFNEEKNQYERENLNNSGRIIIEFTPEEDMLLAVKDIIGIDYYINENIQTLNSSCLFVNKGEKVKIIRQFTNDKEDKSFTDVYYIKQDTYQNIMEQLSQNTLENIKTNENHHTLQASIDVKEDNKLLFTTMAYEEGMKIKVNGKKVKPKLILDAFIGLELEKGKNNIVIDYTPKGLYLGAGLSITGVVLLVIKEKFKRNVKIVKK